jgi:hypothetical protein
MLVTSGLLQLASKTENPELALALRRKTQPPEKGFMVCFYDFSREPRQWCRCALYQIEEDNKGYLFHPVVAFQTSVARDIGQKAFIFQVHNRG